MLFCRAFISFSICIRRCSIYWITSICTSSAHNSLLHSLLAGLILWPGIVSTREWSLWWCPDASGLLGSVSHDLAVDGARDAVVQLSIQLREHVWGVHGRLTDIPHGSSFHNIADDEFFNRLILGNAASTVGASHWLYMATVMLAASSVAPLLGLQENKCSGWVVRLRLCSTWYW